MDKLKILTRLRAAHGPAGAQIEPLEAERAAEYAYDDIYDDVLWGGLIDCIV